MTEAKIEAEKEKQLASVSKILGEPVFFEANQLALKIRTNLMVLSLVAIVITFYNLKIEQGSSVLGLKVENLDIGVVKTVFYGLFLI